MAETSIETVTITIDDTEYQVPKGMLLIDAITDVMGFDMPRFCHHSRLEPVGMCRMCMAEVENRGRWMNVATCTMRVTDGMQVRVHSEQAEKARKMTLELLLINHPLDCPVCDKGGECMLQDQTMGHGPEVARTVDPRRKYMKPVPISRHVLLDRERCVHCARCTRFVDEIAGEETLKLINRGYHTEISPAFDSDYDSHFTGNTCDICPVGALTSASFRFRSRPWEMRSFPTVSAIDACGSNLLLDVRENVVRRIMPRENVEVNDVWISDRERYDHDWIQHETRLDVPLVRNPATGELEPSTWDDAIAAAAEGLAGALEQGAAGIGGTVLSCEEQYAFQKFVRGILGTNDVATSKPLREMERRAGLTPTYSQIERGKVFFLGGSLLDELPIAWLRVYKAVRKKGAVLLTLNASNYHVKLASSFNLECERGKEALVVNALLNHLYSEKKHNPNSIRPYSRGLTDASNSWSGYSLESAADEAGVDPERLRALAEKLVAAEDLVVYAGQSEGRPDGYALRDALWNLALLLNVPGMDNGGWIEYLPNANARGASDMGLRPDFLPGYDAIDDEAARGRWAEAWGLELPTEPGRDIDGLLEAAEAGELGALVVVGSDVVGDEGNRFQAVRNKWLNQSHNGHIRETIDATAAQRRAALEKVPFLVVADMFLSETAKLADVVLPAGCFAERDGLYVNFEGRRQYGRRATRPLLGVRSDLEIINALAAAVAERRGDGRGWQALNAETAFAEITRLVSGYDGLNLPRMSRGETVVGELQPPEGKYEFVTAQER